MLPSSYDPETGEEVKCPGLVNVPCGKGLSKQFRRTSEQ